MLSQNRCTQLHVRIITWASWMVVGSCHMLCIIYGGIGLQCDLDGTETQVRLLAGPNSLSSMEP